VRRLCATVLVMEIVVIWLAIPVAISIEHAKPLPAVITGVTAAVAAVVLAALARRRLSWTVVGGSVLQALVIAAGVIVPGLYILGAIFAALWITGIWLGRSVEQATARYQARPAGPQAPAHSVAAPPADGPR
jgi:hypothetical protein